MTYVYDLVLNFNSFLYEFYEWRKDDIIYHIKRINLIKVDSKTYNTILDNIVAFDDDFILSIFNKCEYYNNRVVTSIPYAFLLTDTYRVIGLLLDNNGKIVKYSSLLLDEEEYVLDLCDKLGNIKLNYKIIKTREKDDFKTRQEVFIIKYIRKDLNIDYKKKDLNKLKYLYYEYFNKECDDIDYMYQKLIGELDKDINDKHYNLYNLIKVSYSGKTV